MTPGPCPALPGHRRALERLRLRDEAAERLARYLDLLAHWSERINLTGASTAEERVIVLIAAVVPAVPWALPGHLIDVGSGNGSPGLIFAALREDLEVKLLEPRAKRCAFLREAVRHLGLKRVSVERSRHDQYAGPPAETVTVRALSLPLTTLGPLVAAGGRLLAFGGAPQTTPGFEPLAGPLPPGCRVLVRCST